VSVVEVGQEWIVELGARRERVRAILDQAGCDAGLVFGCAEHAEAFRYLTNFTPVIGDSWLVLDAGEHCVLNFTWQLDEARARSGIERWEGAFDPLPLVIDAVAATGCRRLGVVGLDRLPVPAHARLVEALPGVELVDVAGPVTELRRRKSPLEIEVLRRVCQLTDQMLDAARAGARPGVTESELAASLATIPLAAGGGLAFPSTVIGGVEEPIPIRMPTRRALRAGDTLMVDLGAELDGYQGDAARSFVLGRASAEQRRAWDTVRRAYDAVLELTRPGTPCRELHRVSTQIIEGAGYRIGHRVGHGFGLATSFEWPSLDTEPAPLEPGMTICVEPGVYWPGAGNVKIEDNVLITEDGYEVLTHSDPTLEVVP
jgi:Xaa-Pro aminopeptidase